MTPWGLLSDVSTGLSSGGNLPLVLVTAVVAPTVGALGLFVRWTMKQNERLQVGLEDALKTTLPVVERCLATQQDMINVSRSLADLLAQERARPGRR